MKESSGVGKAFLTLCFYHFCRSFQDSRRDCGDKKKKERALRGEGSMGLPRIGDGGGPQRGAGIKPGALAMIEDI
jgi:hypothetical protein